MNNQSLLASLSEEVQCKYSGSVLEPIADSVTAAIDSLEELKKMDDIPNKELLRDSLKDTIVYGTGILLGQGRPTDLELEALKKL